MGVERKIRTRGLFEIVMKSGRWVDISDLEPQTTIYKWMFGETTISYVKIGNHPIETTIYKWLFGVPGSLYAVQLLYI